ncbi:DUF1847 domain-containing protein [Nanoarchaeota archaeon]
MKINCSKPKEELIKEYENLDEKTKKLFECSFETVVDTKASENRIEELKVFCRKMNFTKIGIAFCKGLRKYAEILDKELSKDFEIYSVCCDNCKINKQELNVKHLQEPSEIACNPIGQALALNQKNPDIVIKLGFCIGHDILFSKYIQAPTTTLLVKDRKLKHRTIDWFQN